MSRAVSITTYNIHKGMSPLNRRLQLPQMVDALQHLDTDILFLQAGSSLLPAATAKTPPMPAATTATPSSAACRCRCALI